MGKPIKRIQNVTISRISDTDPDTSYLGTYSNHPQGEFSIDRKHTFACASQDYNRDTATIDKTECDCDKSGDWSRNEYQWFNGSDNYKGEPVEDQRKYVGQDYARMESLNSGDWHYIGIKAECTIVLDGLCQTIKSGGLWGIESDSDDSHLASVEDEELSELRSILYTLGFSKRAIATAFKTLERKEA